MEWGHRLSFAYVAGYEDREAELSALARHIVRTGGLLCSSCQVIFLDTEQLEEGEAFCEAFLPLLNQRPPGSGTGTGGPGRPVHPHLPPGAPGGERPGQDLVRGGLLPHPEAGPGAGALPPVGKRAGEVPAPAELIPVLRRQKGRLQTAGLLCRPEERAELTALLARAGSPGSPGRGRCPAPSPGRPTTGRIPCGGMCDWQTCETKHSPPGRAEEARSMYGTERSKRYPPKSGRRSPPPFTPPPGRRPWTCTPVWTSPSPCCPGGGR